MEKELEALKRIETVFPLNKQGKQSVYREYTNSVEPYYNDFNLVLKALTELQTIRESNPSEALESLDEIRECIIEDKKVKYKAAILVYCKIIKQALLKAQENERVLDVIKKKKVNIGHFYFVVFILKKDYESCRLNNNNVIYNICDTEKDFLTEEEFDLLKRYCEK